MKLVGYLRVSTDDKGQRPERQKEKIDRWAGNEQGVRVVAWIVDEGMSASKTNPFERPKFMETVEAAVGAGADGLVVEKGDRLTRQGNEEFGWAVVELRRRFALKVVCADLPLDQQDVMGGRVKRALDAEMAHEWSKTHAERVLGGMKLTETEGTKSGKPIGAPRKVLSEDELALVVKLNAEGLGSRRIAGEISRRRGVEEVYDRKAKRRRSVSEWKIRQVLKARENSDREKTSVDPKSGQVLGKDILSSQPGEGE